MCVWNGVGAGRRAARGEDNTQSLLLAESPSTPAKLHSGPQCTAVWMETTLHNWESDCASVHCVSICRVMCVYYVLFCLGKYERASQLRVWVFVIMPDLIVLKSWRRQCVCVCVCLWILHECSPQLENRVGSSDYYHHLFTCELIAELISFDPLFADYSSSFSLILPSHFVIDWIIVRITKLFHYIGLSSFIRAELKHISSDWK